MLKLIVFIELNLKYTQAYKMLPSRCDSGSPGKTRFPEKHHFDYKDATPCSDILIFGKYIQI